MKKYIVLISLFVFACGDTCFTHPLKGFEDKYQQFMEECAHKNSNIFMCEYAARRQGLAVCANVQK